MQTNAKRKTNNARFMWMLEHMLPIGANGIERPHEFYLIILFGWLIDQHTVELSRRRAMEKKSFTSRVF